MRAKQKYKFITNRFISDFIYRLSQSWLANIIRKHRRSIACIYDIGAILVSWMLACACLIDAFNNIDLDLMLLYGKVTFSHLLWILPLQFSLFYLFGLYRGFWRFASIQDLRKILLASLTSGLIILVTLHYYQNILAPFATTLLYTLFLISFLSAGRLSIRLAKSYKRLYSDFSRVIIVGAGNAGEGLVRDLLRDKSHYYKPVAFVDDDLKKLGREIHGIRVIGTITDLPRLIERHKIDLVLIAIPSASSASMRSVVDLCEKSNIRCYTLPGIKDLANGRVSINSLRSISLEDLLGRYPVSCDWSTIKKSLEHKTILITGGGGSIGSELCRQIATLGKITKIIIVDNNEFNLYSIEMELLQNFSHAIFYPILLSITDRPGMQEIFRRYQPHFVFHAAAYKHVPLLESQPRIAIYNNIIGTRVLAEESIRNQVEKFILISSDKAVNPTNIMGATKRAAEYFCQNLNFPSQKTQFITVRFGNVLDSAGSVIPLFRKQIENGGPVTVTHPDITRFFMTIPEASQLILQAAFLGQGGEIFVLDMGDPIKIRYLAEQMIKLAGKIVDQEIKIVYTGLRPGEKLYEECFYSNEFLQPTEHAKILRARSQVRAFQEIESSCDFIEKLCRLPQVNTDHFFEVLKNLVPEYQIEPITV